MKNFFCLIIVVFICSCAAKNELGIVENGKSEYIITVSESASSLDSLAATVLQKYIKEISEVTLPISSESKQLSSKEIVIGTNSLSQNLTRSNIKYDGFVIKTENNNIYISGAEGKGALNGVYYFLENYLDCRMYSSTTKVIPKEASISIPNIDIVKNPAFEYRDVHYYDAFNDEYCQWHGLVDSKDKNIWGMYVHTFDQLLPADKYFAKHPEYFALRGNHRVREQLCLSNPKVLEIVISELKKRIEENPGAEIWSVSQNDNYSCCQCEKCKKIDEYEESNSGSIINFVNKVAREFPNKTISTLAYQYSRKAPKHLKPERNVNIMLCTIECFRTFPIESDTSNSGFVYDLHEWSKLTNNIYLWDYVVQFTNLVSPFPNFQVLQPNIKLFQNNNVQMIFEQGAGYRNASEFGELRTYLLAKLLWNPNLNVDSVMTDFLDGYYGEAGKYLREYIYLMQQEVVNSKIPLNIYGDPIIARESYLIPDLLAKYDKLFEKAESSVLDNDEYFNRVKIAKLPLIYAKLEQAKASNDEINGIKIKSNENSFSANPRIVNLLNEFENVTSGINDIFLNEKGLTPEKYLTSYRTMMSKSMDNPLGLFKEIQYLTEPNFKYMANGYKSLTDGKRGTEDHHYNWLGFEGENLEVIIDLEEVENISKVSADFLQTSFSWIFLPSSFEVSLATDGKTFNHLQATKNRIKITREETKSPENAFMHNFSCEFGDISARYVKVKATNIKTCPSWHPGYPYKAWIFTDEIVIE